MIEGGSWGDEGGGATALGWAESLMANFEGLEAAWGM